MNEPRIMTDDLVCRVSPGELERRRKISVSHLGPLNCNWKGDAASDESARARARRLYPLSPCEMCGAGKTERHHKDGRPWNNKPENIAILCRRCHMKEDGRLEEFKRNGELIRPIALERSWAAHRLLPKKTHCLHGHVFDAENTYIHRGWRYCRTCDREKKARLAAKKKGASCQI
jgi:hypothetical protein